MVNFSGVIRAVINEGPAIEIRGQLPWPRGRMLALNVVDWGSIPGQVIPKT